MNEDTAEILDLLGPLWGCKFCEIFCGRRMYIEKLPYRVAQYRAMQRYFDGLMRSNRFEDYQDKTRKCYQETALHYGVDTRTVQRIIQKSILSA